MSNLPKSCTVPGLIPQLDRANVKEMSESFEKCNNRVTGDILKDLINPCSEKLAESLTFIHKVCLPVSYTHLTLPTTPYV